MSYKKGQSNLFFGYSFMNSMAYVIEVGYSGTNYSLLRRNTSSSYLLRMSLRQSSTLYLRSQLSIISVRIDQLLHLNAYVRQKQIHYMITIKAQFNKTLLNLGKNITSLDDIIKGISARYPNFKNHLWEIILEGKRVQRFEQILEKAKELNKQTIKVKVIAVDNWEMTRSFASSIMDQNNKINYQNQEKQCFMKFPDDKSSCCDDTIKFQQSFILFDKQQKEETMLIDLREEIQNYSKIDEQQKKYQIPLRSISQKKQQSFSNQMSVAENMAYTCFKCDGLGTIALSMCQTCEGQGGFKENSKFISFLDKFVLDRLNKYRPILQFMPRNMFATTAEQSQKSTEMNTKDCFYQKDNRTEKIWQLRRPVQQQIKVQKCKQFKAKVQRIQSEQTVVKVVTVGQSIFQRFNITNNGDSDWPQKVSIFEVDSKELTQINSLGKGLSQIVQMKEIKCLKPGNFTKSYRLCYQNEGTKMFFGERFGFNYNCVLVQEKKQNKKIEQQQNAEKIKIINNRLDLIKKSIQEQKREQDEEQQLIDREKKFQEIIKKQLMQELKLKKIQQIQEQRKINEQIIKREKQAEEQKQRLFKEMEIKMRIQMQQKQRQAKVMEKLNAQKRIKQQQDKKRLQKKTFYNRIERIASEINYLKPTQKIIEQLLFLDITAQASSNFDESSLKDIISQLDN